MRAEPKTLVMGGSREAHGLITGLLTRRRKIIASLPEPERMFDAFPVPTRIGAFDSDRAFSNWLQENQVSTVIDASHAFDSDISAMAGAVCTKMDLRYLRVLRPPWTETVRDKWLHVSTIAQAMPLVPQRARVFSNTGLATLHEYAEFNGQKLYVRQTHSPRNTAPYPFIEFVEGTPPFSQFQEQRLFQDLSISHLICRNVGGAASMSKLLAARELAIPVYMIGRTVPLAHLPQVESVVEALAWEANL
ncbi:MAG: precorrin-6A/cobalt-precorrin-6A reductase [Roseobacter sp.]